MEKQSSLSPLIYFLFFLFFFSLLFSSKTLANTFVFNPNTHTWKAIDSNGKVVRTGHGSGGKKYCPDIHRGCKTPSGVFTVWSKGGPGCKSSRYPVGKGGSPMPYCMFFTKYYAIHGSYEVPSYNASHGCIRLYPSDAKWLSHNFIKIGTKVIVKPY
ncbi:enhanced entry protein EnhA [Legionella wadsworthii]|uniref:Enhanced entry protein EnhA n=1 Tax=Legionella wadsworthii TaxID=28088 RepID=A0A378LUF6_9GAMM|nr:L,D-transpeptidase [Legionella wadsworthii]STY29459.1 enhanced entry protein EnhA [Legionella wadsworthii]